jgi:ATP-dependent RNA helicase DDX56/DBP9
MSDAAGARLLDQECTFATLSEELDLDVRLKKGVARLGYVRPTLVQRQCMTLALSQGRDLLVRARTGSGKTLAYCLPILEKILRFHKQQQAGASSQQQSISDQTDFVKAVILVPTRELCDQVYSTLKGLMYYCDEVVSVAVLGGTAPQQGEGEDPDKSQKLMEVQQEAMLRDKPDIVVSTPAGLWRLVKSGKLHLKNSVESLVVDEADLVLSFGYAQDVEHLTRHIPKICQGFLMSATLTPELDSLKKIVLHSPAILKLEEDDRLNGKHNSSNLSQFYLTVPKADKRLVLYVFLKVSNVGMTVFQRYCIYRTIYHGLLFRRLTFACLVSFRVVGAS